MDTIPGKGARVPWDKSRVLAMLDRHKFHYQNVPLPHGLETGGKDRSKTAAVIFAGDLKDRTVLDIGCMNGYFSFEAEKLGARSVTGFDIDPESIKTCRMLADCLGSGVDFQVADIEHDASIKAHDVVLCLNVLHHLRNPLSVLEKIIAATRESLILEVATLTRSDARKLGPLLRVTAPLVRLLPIVFLGGANRRGSVSQSFFFTQSAIHTLLKKHRQDIADVEFVSGGQKGRFIAIAKKRRIGHLHVLAGINAVGKSTFLKGLHKGDHGKIAETLGLQSPQDWTHEYYGRLSQSTNGDVPKMLLQYNISKHLIDGDLHQHSRGLLDLIHCADRVTVTTMWHPADKLRDRYMQERVRERGFTRFLPRNRRKAAKLLDIFAHSERLDALYRSWATFVGAQGLKHQILLQEPGYQVRSPEDWLPMLWSGAENANPA